MSDPTAGNLQRANTWLASEDADMATSLANLLDAVHADGRREGLKEAARVCEERADRMDSRAAAGDPISASFNTARALANQIRVLMSKGTTNG